MSLEAGRIMRLVLPEHIGMRIQRRWIGLL